MATKSKIEAEPVEHQEAAEPAPDAFDHIEDEGAVEEQAPIDPYSDEGLQELRIDPSAGLVSTKPLITFIAVRKPGKSEFIRTHPRLKITTALLSVRMEGQGEITALVKNDEPRAALHQHISMVCLRPTIPRVGPVFLWPIKLPVGSSRGNAWNESAVRAAEVAEREWIQVQNAGGQWVPNLPTQPIATEPEWPDDELPRIGDYLRLAFGKDRLIEDLDHPIARFLLAGIPL